MWIFDSVAQRDRTGQWWLRVEPARSEAKRRPLPITQLMILEGQYRHSTPPAFDLAAPSSFGACAICKPELDASTGRRVLVFGPSAGVLIEVPLMVSIADRRYAWIAPLDPVEPLIHPLRKGHARQNADRRPGFAPGARDDPVGVIAFSAP
jgi:hypothetical protein